MSAAATRAPLWGVGQWEAPGGVRCPWEISTDEMTRDMAAAARSLAGVGIGAGAHVLWCSMLSEAGQFWPFVVATMMAGAKLSCADATEAEAPRLAMFCRLIPFRAVFGLTGALVDGLVGLGHDPAEVLGNVEVIGARPDALTPLRTAGLAPHHFVLAGPAIAIGRAARAPAMADPDEWELGELHGQVVVTARRERATAFSRTPTAVRGQVVDGGVYPAPAEARR